MASSGSISSIIFSKNDAKEDMQFDDDAVVGKESTVSLIVKRVQLLSGPYYSKTCSQRLLLDEDPPKKYVTRNSSMEKVDVSTLLSSFSKSKTDLKFYWMHIINPDDQEAFQELLPLFTRAASLKIIAIDLSERTFKTDRSHRTLLQDFYKCRNIEFLKNAVSSSPEAACILQPYCTPQSKESAVSLRCPEYFVLGTHSDVAKVTPHLIAEFKNELSSLKYESEEKEHHIKVAGKIIYPVNKMLKPGPERQEASKKLCTTLFAFYDDASDDTYEMPVQWFAFELSLLEKAGNDSYLRMHDVLSIGRSLQLNEDDTKKALEYLHKLNIIFYYHQVLPDVVFLDPHPILGILSYLAKKLMYELRMNGIFTESLLDKLKFDQGFSKSDFIKLLLHLNIIVKTHDGYFIPSALSPNSSINNPGSDIKPLQIFWQNPVTEEVLPIPRGIFPLTVVNLMKFNRPQFRFPPAASTHQKYFRYQGAMSFRVFVQNEHAGTIHFLKKYKCIEIYFETNAPIYCPVIRKAVDEAICRSSIAINLKPSHKFAFACSSTVYSEKKCYCIVTNEAKEKIECTLCPKSALISGQEYWNWFHVTHNSSNEDNLIYNSSKTLDVTDLQKLLNLLGEVNFNDDHWEGLGLELGLYKQPTLARIQQSPTTASDSSLRVAECLAAWLLRVDAVDQKGGATYVSLANAVDKMGQNAVADLIRKKCQIDSPPPQEKNNIAVSDAPRILDTISLKDVRSSLQESKFCDSKWLDLGDQLGLHHKTLNVIEGNHSADVSRCLRETIVKWLDGVDNALPLWSSLVSALEAIEEKTVAEHIRCKWIKRKHI